VDDLADGHDLIRSFVTRARLIAANGSASNQVILIDPTVNTLSEWLSSDAVSSDAAASLSAKRQRDLVRQMDLWLEGIAADSTARALSEKIASNRPPDLAEGCWQVNGKRRAETVTYDGIGRAIQMYPAHSDPRLVAGAPLTDDVLKCALKPINPADYGGRLTDDQLRELRGIFPVGVCDYGRPGIGQQMTKATRQSY
jgi:Tannase-like family of unknown function (DUF6351)